jgi:hypothetical protein
MGIPLRIPPLCMGCKKGSDLTEDKFAANANRPIRTISDTEIGQSAEDTLTN